MPGGFAFHPDIESRDAPQAKQAMVEETFQCQCIFDTLDGLRDGLSRYSRPSRAALVYAVDSQGPVRVFDPQNLLRDHEPRLKELYIDSDDWRQPEAGVDRLTANEHLFPEGSIGLTGLVSFGGRSRSIFYQMWFTEHHPDMCSVGPTERWLEHAAYRLSHDFSQQTDLYTGISGSFLREYAAHAVRDYIIDEMYLSLGMDTSLRVYPILDSILGISRTREEGAWARGQLMFVQPSAMHMVDFVARFPVDERPQLENFKHVRKLLTAVEHTPNRLVSDGMSILGVANDNSPRFSIVADFRGGHGFLVLNGEKICSFFDGNFHSTTHRAKLVQVEETFLESDLDTDSRDTMYKIVSDIVHTAETGKYGCTLVIDLNPEPVAISGQTLVKPLDLCSRTDLDLAKSFAKVDGALHIGADMKLHAFACLLDGRALVAEDRARGARFNSALRFTAEHRNLIVVVVSSDRPVSIIQEGVELSAQCPLEPVSTCMMLPPALEEWIRESEPD